MSTRNTLIIVTILIVLSTLAGLLLWNRLPDPMASHWGMNNEVNGTISKFWGVFLMPVITVAIFLLFVAIPLIDPLKENIAKFRGTFNTFTFLIVAFMVYIYGLTIAWNLGYTGFQMSNAVLPALGLLFIFVGGLIEKSKRNFFIGIRTPWTLSSDTVWEKTHRVGGPLFKLSGVLAFIGIFFPAYAFWFLFVPLMGSAVFLIIYSYVLFKREATA